MSKLSSPTIQVVVLKKATRDPYVFRGAEPIFVGPLNDAKAVLPSLSNIIAVAVSDSEAVLPLSELVSEDAFWIVPSGTRPPNLWDDKVLHLRSSYFEIMLDHPTVFCSMLEDLDESTVAMANLAHDLRGDLISLRRLIKTGCARSAAVQLEERLQQAEARLYSPRLRG